MDTSKKDTEIPKRGIYTMGERRALGLVCDYDDEKLIVEVLNIFRDEKISVDRTLRVLADARSMLPKLAKIPIN